ncbi:Sucrose-phosphate synthase [Zostera marina]|uniref:Sucrose-phosphate synthase n=1 Tax=Zostera marina TaxID=29655 RepID=A0A0K9PAL4_ZOSMR|nr:Sucrose-phosphate synthase [Zostera marina]
MRGECVIIITIGCVALNVPMVLTGHSLSQSKYEQFLKQGRMSRADINSTYKITRRIEAEKLGLDSTELVVTSTRQEMEEEWGLYDGFDTKIERKLRVWMRRGVNNLDRYMPRVMVMPGMDFSYVNQRESSETNVHLKTLIGSRRKRKLPSLYPVCQDFFTSHCPRLTTRER